MRAVVIGVDGSLDVCEVPEPVAGPHGLLIDVAAAAVNRADLAQRQGRHDPALAAVSGDALIAGMDAAGVIGQIGDSVTGFRVGDRVMGLLAGGYAERAVLDARLAIPVPDGWSLVEGAAAVSGLQTEYDALVNAGQLNAGEVVVIHGASTPVVLTGIQIARHLAAGLVIATIRTPRADAEVRRAGADVVIHTSRQALPAVVQASTQRRGADLIIDHVGGDSLSDSVRSLAIGGRLVSVGRLAGATGQLDLEALAYKRHGLALRSGRIVKQMSKLSSKHQVTIPVSILREAGLAAGDEVIIRASGRGRIEIERSDDLVRRFAGSLPAGTYPDGYLDELRGEWRE